MPRASRPTPLPRNRGAPPSRPPAARRSRGTRPCTRPHPAQSPPTTPSGLRRGRGPLANVTAQRPVPRQRRAPAARQCFIKVHRYSQYRQQTRHAKMLTEGNGGLPEQMDRLRGAPVDDLSASATSFSHFPSMLATETAPCRRRAMPGLYSMCTVESRADSKAQSCQRARDARPLALMYPSAGCGRVEAQRGKIMLQAASWFRRGSSSHCHSPSCSI